MSNNPEDEPLGGKPILPAPSAHAQKRASPLFARYLAETRVDPSDERSEEGSTDWAPSPHDEPTRIVSRSAISPHAFSDDEAPTRARRAFSTKRFASGRRYDQTLAFIQAMAGPLEQTAAPERIDDGEPDSGVSGLPDAFENGNDDSDQIDADELARLEALANPEPDPEPDFEPTQIAVIPPAVRAPPLDRPPPFAAVIRPSPPPRRGPEAVDQSALESMVDTSMLIANPDGTAAFEIAFDDEVFQNLACSISVTPAGVVATFKVTDPNTRRLLEAEAGNLRVRLSERGLKVAEVRVESE